MDDLSTWLLEAIAEDEHRIERVTLAATGGWRYDRERFRLNELDDKGQVRWNLASRADDGESPIGDVLGEYMELFQPARMLAECEAKRRVLVRHTPRECVQGWLKGTLICGCSSADDEYLAKAWPCADVRDVVLPYADRPGYLEEWKPQ